MDNITKQLYNFLDEAEGKAKGTTEQNVKKEKKRQGYNTKSKNTENT